MNMLENGNNARHELLKIEERLIKQFTPVQQKYIAAALQPTINSLPEAKVTDELISIISALYTIAGQKPDATTLVLYVVEFYRFLMEQFPIITMQEIGSALRRGIYADRSHENQYYGLNVKTFVLFIREYFSCYERKNALSEFNHKRLRHFENDTPIESNFQDNADFVNYLYNLYCNEKLVTTLLPVFVYQFLCDHKKINLSKEDKTVLLIKAKSIRLKQTTQKDKIYFRDNLSKPILHEGGKIECSKRILYEEEKSIVKIIAKQCAIESFFEKCKRENIETIFP